MGRRSDREGMMESPIGWRGSLGEPRERMGTAGVVSGWMWFYIDAKR